LGFAINGLIDEKMDSVMRKGGMQPGDVLLLTKPIGTGTGVGRFTGSLDGQGYAITGLYINRAASDYQGLFGSTSGATITRTSRPAWMANTRSTPR
jgi:selenide,water dikinase